MIWGIVRGSITCVVPEATSKTEHGFKTTGLCKHTSQDKVSWVLRVPLGVLHGPLSDPHYQIREY